MKLNPPASSSDLDAARAVARRLHQRARGHDRAAEAAPPELPAPPAERTPPVSPVETPGLAPEPSAAGPAAFDPAAFDPSAFESTAPESAPFEPAAFEPAAPEAPPFEPATPESDLLQSSPGEPAIETSAHEETPPELPEAFEGAADAPDGEPMESTPPEAPPEQEAEETASADESGPPDAMPTETGAPWDGAPEGLAGANEIDPESAFGALGATDGVPGLEGLEPPSGAGSPEDLVGDSPGEEWGKDTPLAEVETSQEPEPAPDDLVAPPTFSFDDIADSCLALTGAHGAMLVDPSGQVLTSRGAWPEPGPEAIGGRLVSMMEKTLQDAPTRSVSAPLAGQHLTAWRVPTGEGFLTVVFMGDAPLGGDVRHPVDAEIKQALG